LSFRSEVLAAVGSQSDSFDISASVRTCYFYDFDGYPTRIWDGQGVLTTTTSHGGTFTGTDVTLAPDEWLGTVTASGGNLHQSPELRDPRDSNSPEYTFGMLIFNKDMRDSIKADTSLAEGRSLSIYDAIMLSGEGLRPQTAIQLYTKLTIQSIRFLDEPIQTQDGSNPSIIYRAQAICRDAGKERSRAGMGTYTDVSQRERARLLGLPSDSGCSYVSANARRVIQFP
jgi:hypothetical protein